MNSYNRELFKLNLMKQVEDKTSIYLDLLKMTTYQKRYKNRGVFKHSEYELYFVLYRTSSKSKYRVAFYDDSTSNIQAREIILDVSDADILHKHLKYVERLVIEKDNIELLIDAYNLGVDELGNLIWIKDVYWNHGLKLIDATIEDVKNFRKFIMSCINMNLVVYQAVEIKKADWQAVEKMDTNESFGEYDRIYFSLLIKKHKHSYNTSAFIYLLDALKRELERAAEADDEEVDDFNNNLEEYGMTYRKSKT